jgi:hypothetical protein
MNKLEPCAQLSNGFLKNKLTVLSFRVALKKFGDHDNEFAIIQQFHFVTCFTTTYIFISQEKLSFKKEDPMHNITNT